MGRGLVSHLWLGAEDASFSRGLLLSLLMLEYRGLTPAAGGDLTLGVVVDGAGEMAGLVTVDRSSMVAVVWLLPS